MVNNQGKLLCERLVQDLEDARSAERRVRESLIQNASAASIYEPQIRNVMKRVMQLEDDVLRLQINDEKIAHRDPPCPGFSAWFRRTAKPRSIDTVPLSPSVSGNREVS